MSDRETRAARAFAVALALAMAAFFVAFGWHGLLNDGVSLFNKFERRVVHVGPDGIVGFGALSFFFASLTLAVALRSRRMLWGALFLVWAPFAAHLLQR
ncbi:MAG: hypothetical protein N2544_16755 [Burkholderiales bacterium]|nr:hypothetical protein [Burkholderiales bacterium]